jgi:hypothetical protein
MNTARTARVGELSVMDQIAHTTLSPASLSRYTAYRNALIADGQEAERIVELLGVFIGELMQGCSANGVH